MATTGEVPEIDGLSAGITDGVGNHGALICGFLTAGVLLEIHGWISFGASIIGAGAVFMIHFGARLVLTAGAGEDSMIHSGALDLIIGAGASIEEDIGDQLLW